MKDEKKLIEESIKETTPENLIGEAPASATLSVITPLGFNTLFTIRDMSVNELLKKIDVVERNMMAKGYKPQVKMAFGQKKEIEYVKLNGVDMVCPTCKVGKVKIIHAKDGKTYYGCDQSKYNPTTRTSDGCKYFTSQDPSKVPPMPSTELTGHEMDDQWSEPY